jgi:hypothetical protein
MGEIRWEMTSSAGHGVEGVFPECDWPDLVCEVSRWSGGGADVRFEVRDLEGIVGLRCAGPLVDVVLFLRGLLMEIAKEAEAFGIAFPPETPPDMRQ